VRLRIRVQMHGLWKSEREDTTTGAGRGGGVHKG
jgi:hypothetical protein